MEVYAENNPFKRDEALLYVYVTRNINAPVLSSVSQNIFDYHDPTVPVVRVPGSDADGVSVPFVLLETTFSRTPLVNPLPHNAAFWGTQDI